MFLFSCLFTALALFGQQEMPDEISSDTELVLMVEVSGYQPGQGSIKLALYDSEDGFPEDTDKAIWKGSISADNPSVTFTVNGLVQGTYAVSVYHDKDGDGELDMSFFGPPSEPVAASNNATGTLGPPSFDDASFHISDGVTTINITME